MKLIRADFLAARRDALSERERLINIAAADRRVEGKPTDYTLDQIAIVNATIVALRHYLKTAK